MTALILPACNEAECLPLVLAELLPVAESLGCVVAVGLNDTQDKSTAALRAFPAVIVGHSTVRGYGQGCVAAMEALHAAGHTPERYIFLSADGAHDPHSIAALIEKHEAGAELVLGQRTLMWHNWRSMGITRILSNLVLGAWASLLSGHAFADIGPYRLISAKLMRVWETMPRDLRWGWTIEPQVLAPQLSMKVATLPVLERPRIAGQQKVTGVSLRHTLHIARAIIASAWQLHLRVHARPQCQLSIAKTP